MITNTFVKDRVNIYYWKDDFNCTTTTLKILAEAFEIPLHEQVISSAIGLPGAAQHGALCGLVSGTLMFIGIWGRKHSIPDSEISDQCNRFSTAFDTRFGSLQCSVLRPEGFHPDNPPHLCEPITCKALELSIAFFTNITP